MGQSFDSFDAAWKLAQVEILFRGVTIRVDVGLLSIDSARGRDHRQRAAGALSTPGPGPAAPMQPEALQSNVYWAMLRGDPRYRALMAKVKGAVDRQRAEIQQIDARADFTAKLDAAIAERTKEAR